MTPLTLDEMRELAVGYVFGTLTLEERLAFDQGLANEAMARELAPEIAAHRAAAEHLATAVAVAPPIALAARVAARIAAEKAAGVARATPAASSPAASSPAASSAAASSAAEERSVRDAAGVSSDTGETTAERAAPEFTLESTPSLSPTTSMRTVLPHDRRTPVARRAGRAGWITAGVLGLALAASIIVSVDLSRDASSLRRELAVQIVALADTRTTLAEREQTLATVLGTGSDVKLVRLDPSAPQGPGMQVFWNVREGRAIVSASGLAQIAKDRAYTLWMIRDSKPVALALFTPDAAGRAVVRDIVVPTDANGVAAFAVTEEPAAGSPQPTMTPFLVGAVPKG